MMGWLYVSNPYHAHAKNVARALLERDFLFKWLVPILYSAESLRSPSLQKILKQRLIHNFPDEYIQRYPWWEMLRLAVFKLKLSPLFLDSIWEKCEFAMDRHASCLLDRQEISGVIGFEHGCLSSLKRSKELGKKGIIVFSSVHHSMREKWVDAQYREHSAWADPSENVLLKRARIRDQRRDAETEVADLVFANSAVTGRSLIEGGVSPNKVISIPLGLGTRKKEIKPNSSDVLRVIFVGAVALHKGFHVLQKAILEIPSEKIKLDVFGHLRVSSQMLARDKRVTFHGVVNRERLAAAYADSDILVFPSYSDGFGQAAAEALGHGVPIIVSENAGICSFIENGKNGFRVPPGDSDAIKAALLRCLDDRPLLEQMKFAAFETAKGWTWNDFRREWLHQFIQKIGL